MTFYLTFSHPLESKTIYESSKPICNIHLKLFYKPTHTKTPITLLTPNLQNKLFYHNINPLILCRSCIPVITYCYYIFTLNPYSIYTPHIIPTQFTHLPLFISSINSILLSRIHLLTILPHSSNAKIISLLTYYVPNL